MNRRESRGTISNVRRLAVRVLFVLVFAGLAAAGAGAVGPPEKTRVAVLRLVDDKPLVLRGKGFKPSERVRLTVEASGQRRVRTLVASYSGGFVAIFTQLRVDPCELEARAAGAAGTNAAYKLPERMCPIPLAPD